MAFWQQLTSILGLATQVVTTVTQMEISYLYIAVTLRHIAKVILQLLDEVVYKDCTVDLFLCLVNVTMLAACDNNHLEFYLMVYGRRLCHRFTLA